VCVCVCVWVVLLYFYFTFIHCEENFSDMLLTEILKIALPCLALPCILPSSVADSSGNDERQSACLEKPGREIGGNDHLSTDGES
jgi:hypothetical protein